MKNTSILGVKHIFFVGIGGISMSGLAKLMLNFNIKVSGSDLHKSHQTQVLSDLGAKVFYEHSNQNIQYDVDLVVYSGAIKNNNPELVFAKKHKIDMVERSEFLGRVCTMFEHVIAISGTHGKTTTTALIGEILLRAGLNPTIHLGGEIVDGYDNFHIGHNKFFVTEACEFKKSLLYINSDYAVVTNIEKDHMDCYKDLQELQGTFKTFMNNAKLCVFENDKYALNEGLKNLKEQNTKNEPKIQRKENTNSDGAINQNQIVDFLVKTLNENFDYKTKDIDDKLKVVENKPYNEKQNIVFGLNENPNYYAENLVVDKNGCYEFNAYYKQTNLGKFKLSISGKYNVENALSAIAVATQLGIEYKHIYKALSEFKGIKRRNELIATIENTKVYADYAHHPTEIEKSIENYKQKFGKLMVIFQPHTYSRTQKLLNEFKNVFILADELVIFKTYPAREKFNKLGTETVLFKNVTFNKNNLHKYKSLNKLKKHIKKEYYKFDCILFLGAGDLYDSISSLIN